MNDVFIPRGIRNNNPGNIRLSKVRWMGQAAAQEDADFVVFDTAVLGLRALMRLLLTYHVKYGLDTVESIINRYAPPHENATDHYIAHVARIVKADRRARIDLGRAAILKDMARAIVRHENGQAPRGRHRDWYTADVYDRAAAMALQH